LCAAGRDQAPVRPDEPLPVQPEHQAGGVSQPQRNARSNTGSITTRHPGGDAWRQTTMDTYDAIFVGSGHNALVAAAYLARAGWRVLLLERNDRPGGFVRTEELTLPGFKHDTFATAHPLFVTGPAYAELGPELRERGLRYASPELVTGVSLPDGRTAVLASDLARNTAEADRLAPGGRAAYAQPFEVFGPPPQSTLPPLRPH